MSIPQVKGFFDSATSTISYVVSDSVTRKCAIIDPVLDFDLPSGRLKTTPADRIAAYLKENGLVCVWIIETHIHADHLTAAFYLKDQVGGRIGIAKHVSLVRSAFDSVFQTHDTGSNCRKGFDHLFGDGETYNIGTLRGRAIHTPGHTPACMSHLIGDAVFVGDTIFMPDYGTARCDFPGGDAGQLYDSIHRIFDLPTATRMFLCHDYPTDVRPEPTWETTVGEQIEKNIHVRRGISRENFMSMRTSRDSVLRMPALMLSSVQVNMCAGRLPDTEKNGLSYIKIPINAFSE